MVAQRQDLVSALVACTDTPFRGKARRFASGLSADELQFIAEYIGACILESSGPCRCTREELARQIAAFQHARRPAVDQDHKMILLLEYLCRTHAIVGQASACGGIHPAN
jgi:hypothetical protein